MRISDWSSDVCSSDLRPIRQRDERTGGFGSVPGQQAALSQGVESLMSQDMSDSQLKDLWRQGKIPVIFKRNKPLPALARIPFAEGTREWLRDGRRSKPAWWRQFTAGDITPTRFARGTKI